MKNRSAQIVRQQKVFFLSPHYSEYTIRLANAFCDHSTVLVTANATNFENEITSDLMASISPRLKIVVRKTGNRWADLLFAIMVIFDLITFQPDVIIAPEMGHWYYTPLVALIAKIFPIALIVHDPEPHSGKDSEDANRISLRIRKERNSASMFIVHGRYCAERLRAVYSVGQRPLAVIPHGPLMICADRTAAERILFFGRMQRYKGIGVLARALEILADQGLFVPIVLAGRGPELAKYRPALERIQTVDIEEHYVSASDAARLFRSAIFVLAPYLDATQSGVVAAAFGNGRPVIASAVGSIPEVVIDGENGILVPPGDPIELANAIRRAIQDRDFLEKITIGAEKSIDAISWSNIYNILYPLIRKIL